MEHRFQVNLKGIITLLSENLYSGPKVFVRELLQNAVDAIRARQSAEPGFADGRIELEFTDGAAPTLVASDNGIGLTEQDVHQFLATIGASSKRDELGRARGDFIGQFGIGLLSCFMVADEIVVITRSIQQGASPVEWRGRNDGTYAVRTVQSEMSPGTRVFLRIRPDMRSWCTAKQVSTLAEYFGSLLPVPIEMRAGGPVVRINGEPPPWRENFASLELARQSMMDYGRRMLGGEFIDVIPLQSAAGKVEGLAYVLPHSPSPAARGQHRVYLKNMLLSENADGILPEWAFFVRCIVNADGLRPSASREAFYEDAGLEQTRQQLGQCLRGYLLRLASQDPDRLTKLIALHYLAIKALAVHDEDFYRIFIDWLPFETSTGPMTLGEYRRQHQVVRYVTTVEQFRQVSQVAAAQQLCIVNGGYTYDGELLARLPAAFPNAAVEVVDAGALARSFEELTVAERNACFGLIRAADAALQPFRCAAEVVKFLPRELPALYTTSRDAMLHRSAERSRDVADEHWAGVLGNVIGNSAMPHARLFLNHGNPLVGRLAALGDEALLRRCVEMLYVQSLLLGMHPLSARELALLNDGLLGLIDAALPAEGKTS